MSLVYLLHFDRRLHHAGHYLGTAADLDARLAEHAAGRGARLTQVLAGLGIGWRLARTWEGGRRLERKLKARKSAPRLCPICRGRPSRAASQDPQDHRLNVTPGEKP